MLTLLTLSSVLAVANAQDAFRFEYSTQTSADGAAYLIVSSPTAQDDVVLHLWGSDGSRMQKRMRVPAGGRFQVRWSQMPADVHYEVRFGKQRDPAFVFDVHRAAAMRGGDGLQLVSSDQDLVKHSRLRYRLPFAIVRYHNTVYGLDGQVLAENKNNGELSYAAGEHLDLAWSTDQEVFMVKTRVEDIAGRYAQDIRVPWSFDIPHTDLVFDSGSAKIRPSERPKLDEAFAIIANTLARLDKAAAVVHGQIGVTLFVVGHTDTVGPSASNERLSLARAKSIARYFRQKGTWCGIEYAGMGEKGLARPTADNVENEANRRAVYTLALATPTGPDRPRADQFRQLSAPRARTLTELPALPASFAAQQRASLASGPAQTQAAPEDGEQVLASGGPDRLAQGPASPGLVDDADASDPQVRVEDSDASASAAPASVPTPGTKRAGAHGKRCSLQPGPARDPWIAFAGLVLWGWRRGSRAGERGRSEE